jgi:site-specific recombinase XerD
MAWRVALEARGLGPISVNVRITAVRKLAVEAADNRLLAPELASGIARIKGVRSHGVRVGNWLSLRQAQALLNAPDVRRKKGLRDRAMFATLLRCGLRRSELTNLTMKHVQQRDNRWCIVDPIGKHGRVRTIPMPAWVNECDRCVDIRSGRDGGAFVQARQPGGSGLRGTHERKVVWQMLKTYVEAAGLPDIAPHDLRRTTAKLCRAAGGELEQIQLLLGHSAVQTTERYPGTKQDLAHAPNDAIKLKLAV